MHAGFVVYTSAAWNADAAVDRPRGVHQRCVAVRASTVVYIGAVLHMVAAVYTFAVVYTRVVVHASIV
eukprot:7007075-Pyramimonas_sp.AAC.1